MRRSSLNRSRPPVRGRSRERELSDDESDEDNSESEAEASEAETSEDEPIITKTPTRKYYTGKAAAKPSASSSKSTSQSPSISPSQSPPKIPSPIESPSKGSPPRSILRQNSPSKGTSVKFIGQTSNRLRDFFLGALSAFETSSLIPAATSPQFKEINQLFEKEKLKTRLVKSAFVVELKDIPQLTEEKIKKLILAILNLIITPETHYSVLAKINDTAAKYEVSAYLVPLSTGDRWCSCK